MDKKLSNVLVLALVVVGCSSDGAIGTETGMIPSGAQPNAPGTPTSPSPTTPADGTAASPTTTPNPTPAATPSTTPSAMANPTMGMPGAPTSNTPGGPAQGTAGAGAPSTSADGTISKECQGFSFEGLVYSPGGEVLPNKCKEFHATTNNPYAVRCVDAWPWFKTEYAGDNFCVLPPAPGKGVQLGHHPQGEGDAWFNAVSKGDMSGYDKAKIPKGWSLAPSAEEERNIVIKHTNEGGKYWRRHLRMRGGSHHMINSTSASANTNTWGPGSPDGLFSGASIPGSQRTDDNGPQSATVPPEDVGLYMDLPANVGVLYNMHHFNPTEKPILKEAWINLWWTDSATRKVNGNGGLPIEQALGTFAQPGQIVDMHYSMTAPGPVRIMSIFGHRHAWTTNFTAWVERKAGGAPEIVYQSFDWFDEPTYSYNSQVKNPTPDFKGRTDGGYSGILNLEQGDELHFNCHIEYTDERAKEENSPVMPRDNGPLRFANEAFTAEMCILFGGAIGTNGAPTREGPPPDFAKAR